MPPGPAHARQRRRRLLTLIALLLGVSAFSPRLRETFIPPENEREDPRMPRRLADLKLARQAVSPSAAAAARAAADPSDLFAYVPAPGDAKALQERAPVAADEIHYVALNEALVVGKDSPFWKPGGRVTIPLPDGRRVEVVIDHTEALGPDRFTSTGSVVGAPESRAVFAYYQGRLAARFENLPQGDLHLRPMSTEQGDVNQFYVVQPALIPDCGGQPEAPEIRHDAEALFAEGSTLNKIAGPATAVGDEPEALLSGRALVDLLVVYTPAVRAALGSEAAVRVQLDLGVAKVNSDFARSGITARLRLADTMELPYPDDSLAGAAGYQSTALERLRGTRDGWFDEVHARRDEVGADLVTLVVNRADPTSSGIGYLVKDPRGYEASFSAFSVVNTAYVSGDGSVLSHELGHNFGCAHARSDPGATGTADGAFAYSYGYRFSAVDDTGATRRLRTIMAYNTADGGYARVPYFSNPRLTLASFGAANFPIEPPLGVADGVANAADNARTIEAVAFQVGNYRISADYSAAGNLVNVSTRAYVATGARAMFGGFVISGEGPKRVLLRAVGPTLGRAPYNVPGVLNDPVLRVYRGGTLLAENDDWGRDDRTGQAGYAAQVSAANERAGAFPLLEGARDAALLLELESGAYSAVVTGKGDAVGEALVEAYELGRDGSRLINLSTRAFGSRENPIIAGFVVTADPERPHQRKRMLVRVLGPSLAAYGLAAADLMQDPVMQVYGADGQLVLENDDWDSPSTTLVGGDRVSIATLTRGQVDQYSEKLVYAAVQHTGVSMHPVEPAVIVELAPGAYSVRVQPFANARNPPSEPGIAIIEVYELAGDGR